MDPKPGRLRSILREGPVTLHIDEAVVIESRVVIIDRWLGLARWAVGNSLANLAASHTGARPMRRDALRSLIGPVLCAMACLICPRQLFATEALDAAAKEEFLARVAQVSAQGDLFDPASVARSLGLTVDIATRDDPIHFDCSNPSGFTSIRHTTAVVVGDSWYRDLTTGRGRVDVPAFSINPATTTGATAIRYDMLRYVRCRDANDGLTDNTEARLNLEGLPAYACIAIPDISKALPSARVIQATDGVTLVRIAGKTDSNAGTRAEFYFRARVGCALGVTVERQQTWGYRYLAAKAEHDTCRQQADRAYCEAHPDARWPAQWQAFDAFVTDRCKSTSAIFREKGADTEAAPPPVPWRRAPLCQG